MKKNLIIGCLSIFSLSALSFGFYQKNQAKKFEAIAIENEKIAREATIVAESQRDIAQHQMMIAEINRVEAQKQFERAEAELKKRK